MGVHTVNTERGVSTGNAPVSLVVKLPGWLCGKLGLRRSDAGNGLRCGTNGVG